MPISLLGEFSGENNVKGPIYIYANITGDLFGKFTELSLGPLFGGKRYEIWAPS